MIQVTASRNVEHHQQAPAPGNVGERRPPSLIHGQQQGLRSQERGHHRTLHQDFSISPSALSGNASWRRGDSVATQLIIVGQEVRADRPNMDLLTSRQNSTSTVSRCHDPRADPSAVAAADGVTATRDQLWASSPQVSSASRIWLSHSAPSWRPFGRRSSRSQRQVATIASIRIRHWRSRSGSAGG